MMNADASGVTYWYILEDANGDIPAIAPGFKPLRRSAAGFSRDVVQIDSTEINANRQQPVARQGTFAASGNLTVPLSFASHDDLLEAVFQGTWAAGILKVGSTRRSFAILERHTDIGIDFIHRGMNVSSAAFALALNAEVGITLTMVGIDSQKFTLPGDATFAASPTSTPMVTTAGSFSEGGLSNATLTDYNVTIDNQMAAQNRLFARPAIAIQNGTLIATGSATAYFPDSTLYDKFLNEELTSHVLTITEGADTYTLRVPRVIYVTATKETPQQGPITPQYNFSAGFDPVLGTTVQLERV